MMGRAFFSLDDEVLAFPLLIPNHLALAQQPHREEEKKMHKQSSPDGELIPDV